MPSKSITTSTASAASSMVMSRSVRSALRPYIGFLASCPIEQHGIESARVFERRLSLGEAGYDTWSFRAALTDARKSIVLLNRRGYATAVFCRQCGDAFDCPMPPEGKPMSDGRPTPGIFDGMGAFPGPANTTILIRNHENRSRPNEITVATSTLPPWNTRNTRPRRWGGPSK